MEELNGDFDTWPQAVSYLGADLTSFILACDTVPEPAELTDAQLEVANLVLHVLSDRELSRWDPVRQMNDVSNLFCSYVPQLRSSLAIYLHIRSGGTRPDTASDDRLEELLCELALDAYPHLFVPKLTGLPSISAPTYAHPARVEAETVLFSEDEPLMRLFPHADFGPNPEQGRGLDWELQSHMIWSDGGVQTLQMLQLPETILKKSSGALEEGKSGLESYVSSVRGTLAMARALAKGESVEVPVLAGCYSVSLADEVLALRLAQGRFRAKTAMDEALVNGNEDVVLELPTPFSLVRHYEFQRPFDGAPDSWPRMSPAEITSAKTFRENIQDRISMARMAVLLSSKDDEVLAIGQSFMTVVNPLASGHSSSMSPLAWPMAQFQSRPLEVEDEAAIQEWDALLVAMPRGLRTGRDRLLAAVSERYSPYDGFIDAVIVWENLFGAAGETGLRVCGSLARLLHPDDAGARSELFKKAKEMYDKRSKLVHGGQVRLTVEQVTAYRNDAVQIAVRAWRKVLTTEALRGVDDSAVRSNLVLLGD